MKRTIPFFVCSMVSSCILGCAPRAAALQQGTYESVSVTENGGISKARFVLGHISEAEYVAVGRVNVIEDGTVVDSNKKYYGFALYFLLDAASDYVRIETSYFDYKKDSGSIYTATLRYSSDEFSIAESFVFDCSEYSIFWFLEGNSEFRLTFRCVN